GVVDDLIVYLRADDDVFLIPNASNTAEVVRRLQAAAPEGLEISPFGGLRPSTGQPAPMAHRMRLLPKVRL
ncbi:MAG: hypothetical protein ABIN96_17900, partial [Rubrivivax sp.]